MKFVKIYSLRIYTAEDGVCGGAPFYRALLEECRRQKIAGGTLVRAEEGYGAEVRGMEESIRGIVFSGSYDRPVVVEICDSYDTLARLFPFLEKHGDLHFLAVIEAKHALFTRYMDECARRLGREDEVHLLDRLDSQ